MVDFAALKAPFPMDSISWRASHMNKEGTKALALAYVNARDVMNRLDEVCGEAGWQCRYSHANGKTVCDIGIKVNSDAVIFGDKPKDMNLIPGEWVWKADGAGDSDIEAEKGALSDAFKRAAVRWGIGRYLYDLESPWVPCESYDSNGKKKFSRFTSDPWQCIKPKESKSLFENHAKRKDFSASLLKALNECETEGQLKEAYAGFKQTVEKMASNNNDYDQQEVVYMRSIYAGALARIKENSIPREGSAADISALKNGTLPHFIGRKN